jgi:hypothetical protein
MTGTILTAGWAHGEPFVLEGVAIAALTEQEDDMLADVERIDVVALQQRNGEEGLPLRLSGAVNEPGSR